MSGLSMYKCTCIPQMRSCFDSFEVDSCAYVPSMTPTQNSKKYSRRHSSVEGTENKGRSVEFWRSWEVLSSYPRLSTNKYNRSNSDQPRFLASGTVCTSGSAFASTDTNPAGFELDDQDSSARSSDSGRNSLSLNIQESGVNVSNSNNVPSTSNGAIRKCKNISRTEHKRDEDDDSNLTEDDDECEEIREFSSVPNRKINDSKNMKSILPYHHSLGKDVIDNGATLLSSKLQVHTARDRLKTFKNWPNKRIQPQTLADAGFFYCGRADIVECYRCGIKGHNWVENDKPMEDHMKWNRDCPFVRENTTEHDNVEVRQGQDICGNLGVEILPNSRPEDVVETESSLEKLGIQKAKGPSHPEQIIYETRLQTFQNWPKSMKQKPPELAAAGFYYIGVGDQTLCFYCGGGLKDWVEEDDPWEQHALWFPKCNFLLLKKTPAFVEAVHKKHKGLLSSKKEESEIQASCSSSNSDTKETPSCQSAKNEERKSEESATLCKICFKNELSVVFLPCRHMVACIDCASALKECAVCREGIQATVRAFLA